RSAPPRARTPGRAFRGSRSGRSGLDLFAAVLRRALRMSAALGGIELRGCGERVAAGPRSVCGDGRPELDRQLLDVGQERVAPAHEVGEDRLDLAASLGALLDDPSRLGL